MDVTATNAAEVARVTKALLAEFPASEVKIKPAMVKGNRCLALHYIDARLVMDRLDEVVGVNNWKDEYTVLPGGNEVECRLSVRIAGEWVTKADVGGQSEQPDEGDRMKAAYSDALKRAAVKFGVGRFLYRLPHTWMDYDPVKKQIVRPPAQQPHKPTRPPDHVMTADGEILFATLMRSVVSARDEAALRAAFGAAFKAHEARQIADAQFADLTAAKDEKKKQFARQPAA